jgi:hypothetical protein
MLAQEQGFKFMNHETPWGPNTITSCTLQIQ